MTDFEQWFGRSQPGGVEAAVNLTGLAANTDYQISFFTANVGAGQTTHNFYEGPSSSDPLITTFSTSGNQNNYDTWSPGITFEINSGPGAEIDVTIQATQFGADNDSRLTLDGISVVEIPEPSSLALAGMGAFGLLLRRRRK